MRGKTVILRSDWELFLTGRLTPTARDFLPQRKSLQNGTIGGGVQSALMECRPSSWSM